MKTTFTNRSGLFKKLTINILIRPMPQPFVDCSDIICTSSCKSIQYMNIVYSVYFVCSYITSIYSCTIGHKLPMISMPMTQWFYKGQGQIISFHLIKCLLYINLLWRYVESPWMVYIYILCQNLRVGHFLDPKSFEKGQGHIVYTFMCGP